MQSYFPKDLAAYAIGHAKCAGYLLIPSKCDFDRTSIINDPIGRSILHDKGCCFWRQSDDLKYQGLVIKILSLDLLNACTPHPIRRALDLLPVKLKSQVPLSISQASHCTRLFVLKESPPVMRQRSVIPTISAGQASAPCRSTRRCL